MCQKAMIGVIHGNLMMEGKTMKKKEKTNPKSVVIKNLKNYIKHQIKNQNLDKTMGA